MNLLVSSFPANHLAVFWRSTGVSVLAVLHILTFLHGQENRARPSSAEEHYRLGVHLAERGDWDQAIEEFQSALQFKLDYAEAHCDLAVAYDSEGQSELALEELKLALRYKPRFALAQFNLAALLKRLGKNREARQAFGLAEEFLRQHLSQSPDSAKEKVLLAWTLWELERNKEAKKVLSKTLEAAPHQAPALLLLGRIYFSEKNFPEAIKAFTECIAAHSLVFDHHFWLIKSYRENGDRQAAFQYAFGLLEKFSNEPLAFFTVAEEYEYLGKPEPAADYFSRAIALWERSPKAGAAEIRDAKIRLSRVLMNQGDLARSQSLLRQLIEESPHAWEAQLELGKLLLKLKDYVGAAAVLQRSADLQPENREVHLQLGTAMLRLGRKEEAAKHLQISDQGQKAKDAVIFRQLGLTALNAGNLSEAESEFQKALRHIPNSAEVHTDLGLVHYARGDFDRSATYFRKALALNPAYTKALNGLGAALDTSGKREEARQCFEQAVRFEPENLDAIYNLARTLLQLNHLSEAAQYFEKLLSSQSHHPEAHYLYGVLFEQKKMFDQAEAHYRQAISQDPEMSLAHHRLALVLERRGETGLAAEPFEKARDLKNRTVK